MAVTQDWLEHMNCKTKNMRPKCALKKYMESFFEPWEMQGKNSTNIENLREPAFSVFKALKCKFLKYVEHLLESESN